MPAGRGGRGPLRGGERRKFDLLVSFPPHVAAVRYPGLAAEERGFLVTEPGSRRVVGEDRIAPGDAGDFPVKQAFLAFLQADAVAEPPVPCRCALEGDGARAEGDVDDAGAEVTG